MRKFIGNLLCVIMFPAFLFSLCLTVAAIIDPGGHIALIILIPADASLLIVSIFGVRLSRGKDRPKNQTVTSYPNRCIRCPDCGASVDMTLKQCRYCGTKLGS